jgi:hypothetical protein
MILVFVATGAALAGSLGLTVSRDSALYLDGRPVAAGRDGLPTWTEVSADGPHVVESRTLDGRTMLNSLSVVVPEEIELVVDARGRDLAITSIRSTAPPRGPVGLAVSVGPANTTITGTTSRTTTTVLAVPAVVTPAPPPPSIAPPPPVATVAVDVEFLRTDTEWADLYVDGQKVAEFRVSESKKLVKLTPGLHKVEIRAFMSDSPYVSGHLTVAGPGMKVGFSEKGVEVYNIPQAWGP